MIPSDCVPAPREIPSIIKASQKSHSLTHHPGGSESRATRLFRDCRRRFASHPKRFVLFLHLGWEAKSLVTSDSAPEDKTWPAWQDFLWHLPSENYLFSNSWKNTAISVCAEHESFEELFTSTQNNKSLVITSSPHLVTTPIIHSVPRWRTLKKESYICVTVLLF